MDNFGEANTTNNNMFKRFYNGWNRLREVPGSIPGPPPKTKCDNRTNIYSKRKAELKVSKQPKTTVIA